MERTRVWWAVSTALVIAALAVIPSGSLASQATSGSGSYTVGPVDVTNVRFVGDKTIVTETETVYLTGTITGTAVHDLVVTIQGSLFTFRGSGTFTGSVDGTSGGFEYHIKGEGVQSVGFGSLHGTFTITDGTGGLADLSGRTTFEGIPAMFGTYTVEYRLGT